METGVHITKDKLFLLKKEMKELKKELSSFNDIKSFERRKNLNAQINLVEKIMQNGFDNTLDAIVREKMNVNIIKEQEE